MARDFDFQINGRIEWRTRVPTDGTRSFDSPTFRLLGSEWHLRFSRFEDDFPFPPEYYGLVVRLIPMGSEGESESLQTPFSVVTYVADSSDLCATPVSSKLRKITRRNTVDIWKPCDDDQDEVDKVCERGSVARSVRVICLFYGTDPSLKGESESLGGKNVQVPSEVLQGIESLSSDFSLLLEDEILPDARLECGGQTFKAHRSVLAARSRVFRAMFQNGMLESETGAVKVQDMDVDVLEKLLKFLYSGKPEDISEGTAADLYEAADKYDVHSLKAACASWIERNLSAENCVKYLQVADAHSDRDLKAAVVKFILENPSVLKNEAWISLRPFELAIEVFQTYVASTVP